MIAAALSLAAVVYNNVINRWDAFHRGAYVPVNLAFVALLTAVGTSSLGMTATDLGLEGDLGVASGAVALVAIYGAAILAFGRSRRGHLIADRRVAGLRGASLAYHLLVRIPLGTAVTEELLFRGLLFAAWRASGSSVSTAAVLASTAFGLWHIVPAVIGLRMNRPGVERGDLVRAVGGAVVATTLAGLVLTWLRAETGGLTAPIVLHAGVNSTSAFAAVMAARRQAAKADDAPAAG